MGQWICREAALEVLCELMGVIEPGPASLGQHPRFQRHHRFPRRATLSLVPTLDPSSIAHPEKKSRAARAKEAQAGRGEARHAGAGYLQMADWL